MLGIFFILIIVNVNNSTSLQINENDLLKETESNESLTMFVKDGRGLTVEIYNNGDNYVENIYLNMEVEDGKFVIIPKKLFKIPFLAAGKSTELDVTIIGFSLEIFFRCPLISITANFSESKTVWTKVIVKQCGTRTKILASISSLDEPYDGYTLFSPEYSRYTYLIDMKGRLIHLWKSNYIQGFGNYLLENGDLLRLDEFGSDVAFMAGGRAGRVEKIDNKSNLLWTYVYANDEHCSHHDIEPLPNGNVLIIAWESKTKTEAISAGRNPSRLRSTMIWPDHVIEVEPVGSSGGNIVWEWHVWDHLIQDYDSTKKTMELSKIILN